MLAKMAPCLSVEVSVFGADDSSQQLCVVLLCCCRVVDNFHLFSFAPHSRFYDFYDFFVFQSSSLLTLPCVPTICLYTASSFLFFLNCFHHPFSPSYVLCQRLPRFLSVTGLLARLPAFTTCLLCVRTCTTGSNRIPRMFVSSPAR